MTTKRWYEIMERYSKKEDNVFKELGRQGIQQMKEYERQQKKEELKENREVKKEIKKQTKQQRNHRTYMDTWFKYFDSYKG